MWMVLPVPISRGGQEKLLFMVCFMCQIRIEDMSIAACRERLIRPHHARCSNLFTRLFNGPPEVALCFTTAKGLINFITMVLMIAYNYYRAVMSDL